MQHGVPIFVLLPWGLAWSPDLEEDGGPGAFTVLHVAGSQQNHGQHHVVAGEGGAGHHQPCARHPAGMP